MVRRHRRTVSSLVAAIFVATGARAQEPAADLFDAFERSPTVDERVEIGRRIAGSGVSFEAALERLKRGRRYGADVSTGRIDAVRVNRDGTAHPYFFFVPEAYDPSRRYPVRVYLHGSVELPKQRDGTWWRRTGALASADAISVFPHAWVESRWWQESQIESLAGLLSDLKRDYNIDENRVFLFGLSDGGTGVFYHALRAPDPWAAFFGFIGNPGVLGNPAAEVDGEMFATNIAGSALFIVNGESDPLYPAGTVWSWINLFDQLGAEIVFRARPEGHTVSWWPEESARIEAFVGSHPRDPHPRAVDWATERPSVAGRTRWIEIEELGSAGSDTRLVQPSSRPFEHLGEWGRVVISRGDNRVVARTRGIRRFSVLVSPDAFDLARPIEVVVNGREVHDAIVEPDVDVLMANAAIDDDRSRLYAARITVEVP